MEKIKPHYRLSVVQDAVARRGASAFTMTTHADHRIWQNVYRAATPAGKMAYIKVTGQGEGMPPVIQFKVL
ncbi:MAG: type II toxin-antitoxin system MqsR family toxin [Sulfuritalea sp.]|nr:type II toxin-antitoxin system MqsR family toxin [Sulfuritalea sp.]